MISIETGVNKWIHMVISRLNGTKKESGSLTQETPSHNLTTANTDKTSTMTISQAIQNQPKTEKATSKDGSISPIIIPMFMESC
jgi:hypothetical protein